MTDIAKYDNISLGDAREIYMYIEKKAILSKYSFPSKPCKDGYYRIYVPDSTKKAGRSQLFAKSIPVLEDKVYNYEKGIRGKCKKTFKDVFDITVSEKLKYIKDPDKKLSRQNTINKIKTDYKRFFDGHEFEHRFIEDITKDEIEDIIFTNLKKYDLRAKAFNSMKGILRNVFKFAFCQYWIDNNPFERVDFTKFNDMIAQEVDLDKRVHTDEELALILNEIHDHQKNKPKYIPSYALEMQILCGARRGEIPPLRLTDIHSGYIEFSREQITVKRFNDVPEYCKIVEHTKTYKNRYFARYDKLDEFIDKLLAIHNRYYKESMFLFPANNENGVISNNTVYNYYRRICKKLGIKLCREEIKGTHSFRRNAITDVVNASGGNIILASSLFGNSPTVAKKNYYTGIDMKLATEALNKRNFS